MDVRTLAAAIDHTALKPTLTAGEVARLCEEALLHRFAAVCVPPCYVALAAGMLEGSGMGVATVIGFPLGYQTTAAKMAEAAEALQKGATELDVVHNISFIKSDDYEHAVREIRELTDLAHARKARIKIILETSSLTEAEVAECCRQYGALGVDFVKTSTGFAEGGATVEVVALMRQHLPGQVQVKASGGIRTREMAEALLAAGATRLGCSAGVHILSETPHETSGS